ncbi:maltose permease [Coniochaeta ligniaria NRRL 30616]|uniref:Maltose permease n=1 Tax=Coniochaeta ligniaria NRRL 30616 TaxID=1408157 RepID=A0A1J7I4X3_9PEZI|nr:maltose permease [Coniochaeta ligniaria NRRL 30616]
MSPDHPAAELPSAEHADPKAEHAEIKEGASLETKAEFVQLQILDDGRDATAWEHELTPLAALRVFHKAVAWSVVFSLTIIMTGYDTGFLGALYAMKSFQRDFGQPYKDGYEITAGWQTLLQIMGFVSTIIGVMLDGYLSEKIGRKKVTLGALAVVTATIFCQFFAKSLAVLLVGRMLSSVPYGIFAASTTTYAAEICPVALRGYLTTYVCLCWILGQFVSAGVTYRCESLTTAWAYKIPFAVQWAWPLPLFVLISFAPESPWWLVRRGRLPEAERTMASLLAKGSKHRAPASVAMMVHTIQEEQRAAVGTSYLDCFRGSNLRRTEVACVAYGIQALVGSPLQQYTVYFFTSAGLPTSQAFPLNLGNSAISVVGTMLAWPMLAYLGRRTIFLNGLLLMTILYFAIGFASIATNSAAAWAQSCLLIVFLFVYSPSVAATLYAIVGEVGASELRGKTVSLARATAYLVDIVVGVLTPYMVNPSAWNWVGKAGFFFGGLSVICCVWTFYRLPETGGRTYEELDILFEKKVAARKFAKYEVDAYEADGNKAKVAE